MTQEPIKCEFCGREMEGDSCPSCEKDRTEGEAFAEKYGMPWDRPIVKKDG